MENQLKQSAELRNRAEEVLLKKAAQATERFKADSPEQMQQMLHELQVHQIELEMQNEELRRAQVDLDIVRERYFNLYDLAPVGYCTITEKGLILEANLTAATMLGVPRSILTNQHLSRFIFKDDKDTFYLHYQQFLNTRKRLDCELRLVHQNGAEFWVRLEAIFAKETEEKSVCRMVLSDITEHIQAKKILNESHDLLNNLAQMVPGVIYQYRLFPDGRSAFPYASNGMYDIYEVTPEEVREDATPVFGRLHPEDRDRVTEAIFKSAQTLEMFYCEFRVILPTQGLRWRWSQARPRLMEDGSTLWHGIISDVTARKQSEEEVQRNELRLRRLVDILQHPAGTIQELLDYALEQAIQLTGSAIGYIYTYDEDRKEFVLNSWSKDVLPACAIVNPQTCYELDKTGIWGEAVRQRQPLIVNDFQATHPLKKGYPEGHVQLLKFVTIPIFKGERIVSVVGLANKVTDYDNTDILQISLLMDAVWKITDNMHAEEVNLKLKNQLQQAQKMEAIGTLAGGIAHDFNNILGAVIGYAEMARDASPSGSDVANDLDKVLEAGRRAAKLVNQILAFSREARTERIALQPAHLVKETLKLLRPALPSTITIEQQLDTGTEPILADPTQLHQIVMNLCTNAFHAMEQTGGILEITLKDCELSRQDIPLQFDVHPGKFVELAIGDTGTGIPQEIKDKIFEPYFTTKEIGKGTGMGLSIIHGIVTSMGGFVTCENKLEKGVIFRIFIPAIEQELIPFTQSEDIIIPGKERVLFVDDEKILAEMGQIMLERLGYEVTVCTSSIDALTTFQDHPDQFDAVITDQTMPEMTGFNLARRMLQIRPGIPIILCTGYSNLINEEQAKNIGIKGFIIKPMSKKDVAQLLRTVLDDK